MALCEDYMGGLWKTFVMLGTFQAKDLQKILLDDWMMEDLTLDSDTEGDETNGTQATQDQIELYGASKHELVKVLLAEAVGDAIKDLHVILDLTHSDDSDA